MLNKWLRMFGPGSAAILTAVILLCSATPGSAQEGEQVIVDRIVAVVNGEMITLYDMNQAMAPVLGKFQGKTLTAEDEAALKQFRQQYLQRMIDDILITQDAKKWQIEVSDREVEAELDSVKQRNNLDDAALEQQLKLEGMTVDEYKKSIRDSLLKHRILGGRVKRKVVVTEDEIREEYNKNKAQYEDVIDEYGEPTKDGVHVSVIILPPAQSGGEIKRKIEAGEMSFAEAAQQYSIGPSADQGGDLGVMAWSDLAPQWQDVLSKLEPGHVSRPFAINEHEALLMIIPGEKKDNAQAKAAEGTPATQSDDQEYEELRDKIYAKLYQQKLETLFQEYLQKLRSAAVIDNKL